MKRILCCIISAMVILGTFGFSASADSSVSDDQGIVIGIEKITSRTGASKVDSDGDGEYDYISFASYSFATVADFAKWGNTGFNSTNGGLYKVYATFATTSTTPAIMNISVGGDGWDNGTGGLYYRGVDATLSEKYIGVLNIDTSLTYLKVTSINAGAFNLKQLRFVKLGENESSYKLNKDTTDATDSGYYVAVSSGKNVGMTESVHLGGEYKVYLDAASAGSYSNKVTFTNTDTLHVYTIGASAGWANAYTSGSTSTYDTPAANPIIAQIKDYNASTKVWGSETITLPVGNYNVNVYAWVGSGKVFYTRYLMLEKVSSDFTNGKFEMNTSATSDSTSVTNPAFNSADYIPFKAETLATYSVDVPKSGKYDLKATVSAGLPFKFEITINGAETPIIKGLYVSTGDFNKYKTIDIASLDLNYGYNTIQFSIKTSDNTGYVQMKSFSLEEHKDVAEEFRIDDIGYQGGTLRFAFTKGSAAINSKPVILATKVNGDSTDISIFDLTSVINNATEQESVNYAKWYGSGYNLYFWDINGLTPYTDVMK